MLMHGTKDQQCSSFVLDLGVLKLFITLNSYDWLRVHSVPGSISMVHQSSSNVCDPLLVGHKRMNTIDSLSHASTSKRMETHMHSIEYWFSTVQNSSGGLDEWGGVDSLH
jgi:hypothetical protein